MKKAFFLLLVLVLLLPPQAQAAPVWQDHFDSDLFHWREMVNAQLHAPHLPCQSAGVLRSEWLSVEGKALLSLQSAEPCFVAMRLQDYLSLPEDGYSASFLFSFAGPLTQRSWIILGADTDNFLALHWEDGKIYPEKKVAGKNYWFGHERVVPLTENETHFVTLEYWKTQKRLRLFVNHQFVSEFRENDQDPQLSSGTPGLGVRQDRPRQSSLTWYDEFSLRSLETKRILPLLSLQQTDPKWKTEEYDSAQFWSPNEYGIESWGCALVSATMVLRFHGIKLFADGREITPSTLNTWLNAQSDGYIGQGHINWRALTRLTELSSASNGQRKLEFSRHQPSEEEKLSWLKQQLSLELPVILEQPGHFVVAHGFDQTTQEIFISDPYFQKTRLSEYANSYLSARLFRPSYTDLSSIIFVAPPETELLFRDGDEAEIQIPSWTDTSLRSPVSGKQAGRALRIYELVKPDDRILTVTALKNSHLSDVVQIFAYTKAGSVTKTDWILHDENSETSLAVIYEKQGVTEFFQPESDPKIRQEQLDHWLETEQIHSPFLGEFIQEQQSSLLEAQLGSSAQAQQRLSRLLLLRSLELGWVSPWVIEQILRIFQSIVSSRFP